MVPLLIYMIKEVSIPYCNSQFEGIVVWYSQPSTLFFHPSTGEKYRIISLLQIFCLEKAYDKLFIWKNYLSGWNFLQKQYRVQIFLTCLMRMLIHRNGAHRNSINEFQLQTSWQWLGWRGKMTWNWNDHTKAT